MLPPLHKLQAASARGAKTTAKSVISVLFLGLAAAQMIYGPISDSIGRKPAIYAGFAIFLFGCLISIAAVNFPMMLWAACSRA